MDKGYAARFHLLHRFVDDFVALIDAVAVQNMGEPGGIEGAAANGGTCKIAGFKGYAFLQVE